MHNHALRAPGQEKLVKQCALTQQIMPSSSVRVRQWRLRQKGHFAAPLKRRAGRPRAAAITRNSELRRHRRDRTTAPAVLRQFVQQFLRLRIIAKHVWGCTSDVRR